MCPSICLVPYGWHITKSTLFSQLIVLYHHAVSQYIRHSQVLLETSILSPSLLFTFKVSNLKGFYPGFSHTDSKNPPHYSSLKIITNIKNTVKHQKSYQILWYLTIQKFAPMNFTDIYLSPLL